MNHQKIKAVIVDDEAGCISNLRHCLEAYCPDISIVATGHTLGDVFSRDRPYHFDLAFLDIELFDANIFDQLQEQDKIPFKIVFATAYDKYAVRAFRVEALDYILKPLLPSDILSCYEKIRRTFNLAPGNTAAGRVPASTAPSEKKIILKQSDKVYVVRLEDIGYLEAKGVYTAVTFLHRGEWKKVIVSKTISQLEREYDQDRFYRVHKSFLVNTGQVKELRRQEGLFIRLLNGELIPVAKRRISDFLDHFNPASA